MQLHVVNKRARPESYGVAVDDVDGMHAVLPMSTVAVAPLGDTRVPLFLSVSRSRFHGDFPVRIRVVSTDDGGRPTTVTGTFLGPSQ
jgi:hypothetical protein